MVLNAILVGWVVAGIWAFRRLPGPIAALAITIVGTLFLPEVHIDKVNAGAPEAVNLPLIKLAKFNVISYALLFGSLLFDRMRWLATRPRWFDAPMFAWCLSPMLTTIANSDPIYDGAAGMLARTVTWGIPYWMGRLYLGTREGMLAWAAAVVLGGLVYVPLCLIEVRLSPQLHTWVYGFFAHDFKQMMRDGGFRPIVFMSHGLTVAQWMAAATLCCWWLWSTGTFNRLAFHPRWKPISLAALTAALAVTTVLCRSVGPLALGIVGVVALEMSRRLRTAIPLAVLILIPPVFLTLRYTEVWTGQELVTLAKEYVNEERARSLDTRFQMEYKLLAKAKERPDFGWGGSGKWRIYDAMGHDITISDSLWIITVASEGLFGLLSMLLVMQLAPARLLWHYPPRRWVFPYDAGAPAAAAILITAMIDHLVNAAHNPIMLIAIGGLGGIAHELGREKSAPLEDLGRGVTGSDSGRGETDPGETNPGGG